MRFNRSSRVISAIAALLGPAAAQAGKAMPDARTVELTAKAWKMVRDRVQSARTTLWKGVQHATGNDPAVLAAIAKRERRALDPHGMRFASMKRVVEGAAKVPSAETSL